MYVLEIVSTSIVPKIVQSDSGSEVLGYCIKILKENYGKIHIVKGRPRHPQSQGPLKENLQKWMREHPGESWTVETYVLNGQMNRLAQYNHGGFSVYNLYYGKNCTQKILILLLGELAAKHARIEIGILCAKNYCLEKKVTPNIEVTEKEIISAVKKDKIYKYDV